MKGGLLGRQEWVDPVTGKKDGTYFGSQIGNIVRSGFQVGTGLGGTQAVFFDYELRKLKVNVNPGMGKKNFQIIGKDADELSKDLDYKWGLIKDSNMGNSLLGSMGKGLSRGSSAVRSAIPSVRLNYSPVPQKPAEPAEPAPGFGTPKKSWFGSSPQKPVESSQPATQPNQPAPGFGAPKKSWFRGGKTARKGRKARRGTRRN